MLFDGVDSKEKKRESFFMLKVQIRRATTLKAFTVSLNCLVVVALLISSMVCKARAPVDRFSLLHENLNGEKKVHWHMAKQASRRTTGTDNYWRWHEAVVTLCWSSVVSNICLFFVCFSVCNVCRECRWISVGFAICSKSCRSKEEVVYCLYSCINIKKNNKEEC